MADKLSGMEMLMNSLFKMVGFDPKEAVANVQKTVQHFEEAARILQQRLDVIDARQTHTQICVALIMQKLDIEAPEFLPLPLQRTEDLQT